MKTSSAKVAPEASLPSSTVEQTPTSRKAAHSIRTPVTGSPPPSTQAKQGADADARSATRATTKTGVQIKTPQELLSQFTDDDPSQVFQPESVHYHGAVQAEPVDPDWASEADVALERFFSAAFAPTDAYVTADCRTDLCELNIVAEGNDSTLFYKALNAMKHQAWWTELQFDQESGFTTYDGGRIVVVYFFSRK
jgi:hypothetical protein